MKGSIINSELARNATFNGLVPVMEEQKVFSKVPVLDDDENETYTEDGEPITEMIETSSRIVEVGKTQVSCQLVPGLNTITAEEKGMLDENDQFTFHLSMGNYSVVEHDDEPDEPDEPEAEAEVIGSPEALAQIDVTKMSVAKAGKVIGSAATMELLDQFENQENGRSKKDGGPRKGIMAHIGNQRKLVQGTIDAHVEGKKKA